MSLFIVDVESDGPIPYKYSMVCFGAVRVDTSLTRSFYGETAPVSEFWIPEALAVSGVTREDHLTFPNPIETMQKFKAWISANSVGRPILMSDNNGFDAAWINWYFHMFCGDNPFGFSSRRIGDFYAGLVKDLRAANNWKNLRKTKHTHNPVDDARGNAEALISMLTTAGLTVPKE